MEYSLLGRTGVRVSRLALGTMTFGGEADEATSGALLDRAREAGVNFIDTADVYKEGRSEEILGRLMRGWRDEIVLASKAYYPTGTSPNARGSSRYHLVRAVEASLRRLGTDRIDVYYLHHFDEDADIDDSLRALDDLVHDGKIVYTACSNFAAWQVAHALGVAHARGYARFCAIQPMYNLLKRQAEVEIFPMARALGLGAVVYSPTAGGLLTGKYAGGARPQDSRFTKNTMYQNRYADAVNWETAEAFRAVAGELGQSPATLAVRWAISNPVVTSALLGVRSLAQLEEGLAAAEPLDAETHARVSALTPAPPPATDRSEEAASSDRPAKQAPKS